MINKSNIGEVSIEEKGFKLTIKQKEEPAVQQVIAAPVHAQPVAHLPVATAPAQAPAAASADKPAKTAEAPAGNTITIKSPMIGTAYR